MEPGPSFDQLPYELQFDILLDVGYPSLRSYC
jgi:hypothetical protein